MIAARSGESAHEFVPGRRIDAFDQFYCRSGKGKQKLVQPNETFRPEDALRPEERKVYLLDGRNRDPQSVAIALADFQQRAETAGLHVRPLQDLR
jgi:hypothetical protein